MLLEEYPKLTIIMRGQTLQQIDTVIQAIISKHQKNVAIEITLNTKNAFAIIETLTDKYGDLIPIGAGTVQTLAEAKKAIACGAKFLLGPKKFTEEMIAYAKEHSVLSIPGAMSPQEIADMVELGADIVKVFPAAVVAPRFFKDVQAPLGELQLMAVGGVNLTNIPEFFANGAKYVGLGSGMFSQADLVQQNLENLILTLDSTINLIKSI